MLPIAAVFRPAISQDSEEPYVFRFKERHHFVIENIGGGQGIFPVVKFDEGDSGISVNKGLLVNSANTRVLENLCK